MIFDLKSGKRRRVVQVVFGFLAFVFFISFVGFGIGSDAAGGIFDALGIGGGSSSSSDPQYEQQIQDAETTLETDPKNQQALLDLARYHYLSATSSGAAPDPETGAIPEEMRSELELAAQAWNDYLATKPEKPDVAVAANAAQAFVLLGDPEGAAGAQAIVADSQRTTAAYGQLAFYLYAGGKIKQGDAAAEKAVAATDSSSRKQIEEQLAALRKQAIKQQQLIEEQAQQGGGEAGGQQLEDPFGALGGSSGSVTPPP